MFIIKQSAAHAGLQLYDCTECSVRGHSVGLSELIQGTGGSKDPLGWPGLSLRAGIGEGNRVVRVTPGDPAQEA
jgi:hypothetical protein